MNWERKEHWQGRHQHWSLYKQMESLKAATEELGMCLRMLLLPKSNVFTVMTLSWRKLRQRHQFICSIQAEKALMKESWHKVASCPVWFSVVTRFGAGVGDRSLMTSHTVVTKKPNLLARVSPVQFPLLLHLALLYRRQRGKNHLGLLKNKVSFLL